MADLEIPDRARRAAREAYDAALQKMGDVAECEEMYAVRAASSIIVAAELRSYVSALREMVPVAEGTVVAPQFIIDTIARDLQRRADELDPPGGDR